MTSKISFLKLTKESAKRGAAFGVLLAVLYFCYYPIGLLLLAGNAQNSYPFSDPRMAETIGFYMIQNPLLLAVTGLSAVVLGMMQFGYLHAQKKLDLYHSIPVRREKLFGAQCAAGIFLWLAPFAGNLLAACAVCLFRDAPLPAQTLLQGICVNICCFLLAYSFSILSMMLTGKFFAALAVLNIFCGYAPALAVLRAGLFEYYFTK